MKIRKNATFVEYALLAGLVAVIVAVAAYVFGGKVKGFFETTGNKVDEFGGTVKSQKLN